METGLDVLSRAAVFVERADDKQGVRSPVRKETDAPHSRGRMSPGESTNGNAKMNCSAAETGGCAEDAKETSPLKKRPWARSHKHANDDKQTTQATDVSGPPKKSLRTRSPPDANTHDTPTTTTAESYDLPLNLTTSGTPGAAVSGGCPGGPVSGGAVCPGAPLACTATPASLRPSVIIRAAHALLHEPSAPYPHSPLSRSPASRSPPVSSPDGGLRRREILTAIDDASSVDEHFRRSLGKDYPDLPPSAAAATLASPDAGNDDDHDSVGESVDDHFARSLGQTKWNEIKSGSAPNEPSSVDDHFAKALGDQWASIKARQENSKPRLITPS